MLVAGGTLAAILDAALCFKMAATNPARETKISPQVVLSKVTGVGAALNELGGESVFLVADANAYLGSGAEQALLECLANRSVTSFTRFAPNPKLEQVLEGLKLFQEARPQIVLAVGGGTAIDIAKLINFIAAQPVEPLKAIQTKGKVLSGKPLIAIPTTAGSGAEATQFAVLYVDGIKQSIEHPNIRPTMAVVDPALTASMPGTVAVHSGLDALCQSIESLWSVHADEVSISHATEALGLLLPNLPYVDEASLPKVRTAMCKGAHLAGKAINITRTTAAHALSYPLTSRLGLPHGAAVAMLIGPMLLYNSEVGTVDCNDDRGPKMVLHRIKDIVQMFGCKTAAEGAAWLTGLVASMGSPTRLRDVGVTSADQVEPLSAEVNADRLSNNPRKMTPEAIAKMYADLI